MREPLVRQTVVVDCQCGNRFVFWREVYLREGEGALEFLTADYCEKCHYEERDWTHPDQGGGVPRG